MLEPVRAVRVAVAYLTPDEIEELTGLKRPHAQIRELQAMGVPHLVRRNGTPAVHEADARPWAKSQVRRTAGPDYDALRG